MIEFNELCKYVQDGFFTMEKHEDCDLYIFGYHSGPYSKTINNWNSTTKMMRGLIVDSKGKIHSRSFEKFFTFRDYLSENTVLLTEGQIAKLPNKSFKVYEKLDGTLTILYWVDNIPYLSTQRSFKSLKAKKATQILHKKYKHTFDKLRKDRTYIFEAIYPESQVLIDYENSEDLVLIGIVENETGTSLPLEDIGFKTAKDWSSDLKNITNLKDLENLNLKNLEGFVLLYENGFRIKIKFPWYKEAHILMNKLIQLEYNIDLIENKLKEILSIKPMVSDTFGIWERFKKGELPKEISLDFPNAYKFFGIDDWLENEYEKYLIQKESHKVENPQPVLNEKLIKNDLIYKSYCENIMNNRMINLKKKYD